MLPTEKNGRHQAWISPHSQTSHPGKTIQPKEEGTRIIKASRAHLVAGEERRERERERERERRKEGRQSDKTDTHTHIPPLLPLLPRNQT
jgi:hypothetical protein